MTGHTALLHQTALAGVFKLDRVFQREYVQGLGGVEVVKQCRQRGGLARTGGTGHQQQTVGMHRPIAQNRRCANVLQTGNGRRNGAPHRRPAALLCKHIHTKPAQLVNRHGGVMVQYMGGQVVSAKGWLQAV